MRLASASSQGTRAADDFAGAAQHASFVLALLLLAALMVSLYAANLSPLALAGPLGLGLLVLRLRAYGAAHSVLPNLVTALRAALTGGMALAGARADARWQAAVILLVFTLDGVDGVLARRLRATSRLGAHFDMETDGYLVLVVCCLNLERSGAGWVLIGGLLRYAYVLATSVFRSHGEAPPSRFGRYAFSLALTALTLSLLAEPPVSGLLSALGTGVLSWSFGRSFYWAFRGTNAP